MAMKTAEFFGCGDKLMVWPFGNLLMRWKALHPIEDKRYAGYRQKWGANANLYVFGMFHWQGL